MTALAEEELTVYTVLSTYWAFAAGRGASFRMQALRETRVFGW